MGSEISASRTVAAATSLAGLCLATGTFLAEFFDNLRLLCIAPNRRRALSDDAVWHLAVWRLSDICLFVCLSVAYIGPKLRTEKPRKTKIGTEVAHVTRDSDTAFKVKRSKVKVTMQLYSPRR